MPLQIIRNDITKVKADAIVNTANPQPIIGAGTDSAIYKAAGENELLAERKKIGKIARGEIAVTPAFGLKAKYIIHTVGPAWNGGDKGEFDILRSCYRKSLDKAAELGCKSIAFPLIATGVYHFPKSEALKIAMNEISSFLMREDTEMNVKLVVFDDSAFRLSRNLFFQVESYIDDEDVIKIHQKEYGISKKDFERERERYRSELEYYESLEGENSTVYRNNRVYPTGGLPEDDEDSFKPKGKKLTEETFDKSLYMKDKKEDTAFQDHLMKLLVEKDLSSPVVYKSSNITSKNFSKMLTGDTKHPQKKAVLGLCIGMKLNLKEAEELLASADMAFNPYNKRDKLVIQCILQGQYNIGEINEMLYVCNQPQLGN
ncbi:MAG: macro domain-containing protein [Lachnospiraceae bacterium]|nr:macro domain-containing protein [Lachnospiraceae bacterium]